MQEISTQKLKERTLRLAKMAKDGDIAVFDEINQIYDRLETISNVLNDGLQHVVRLSEITRRLPSKRGEKGETGLKGEQGIPGRDGKDGKNGKDGRNGLDGKNGRDGIDGKNGRDGIDGKNGKDAIAIDLKPLLKEIEEIRNMSTINALPMTTSFFNGLRAKNMTIDGATATQVGDTVHITGISSGSSGPLTIISISGTIDDSNVTFTSATEPTLVNVNGAFYQKTGGAITWTYVGTTITLSSPVGVGGSIFGI